MPIRYPGCDAEAGCAAAGAWAAALSFSHPAGLRAEADFAATGRAVDAAGLLPFTTGARGLLPFCLAASRLARHSASCCSIFELIIERGCKASPHACEQTDQTGVLNILNPLSACNVFSQSLPRRNNDQSRTLSCRASFQAPQGLAKTLENKGTCLDSRSPSENLMKQIALVDGRPGNLQQIITRTTLVKGRRTIGPRIARGFGSRFV